LADAFKPTSEHLCHLQDTVGFFFKSDSKGLKASYKLLKAYNSDKR